MSLLNSIDYTVIFLYFSLLIGFGLYLHKRASASLEDYFLGGRSLPWWALGLSGMAAWLDVAGTMLITSFLFMLGPRGLFIEFRGGAVLILPVILLWTGKWHRRSQCITAAEWMIFRFGEGFAGQFARIVSTLAVFASLIGLMAYMIMGIGIFLSTFLPFSPFVCSLLLVGVATLYTLASGFYGVVFTDIFQSVLVFGTLIGVITLAITKSIGVDLAAVAQQVTGNAQWLSASPQWNTSMPEGYKAYENLLMFAGFYLLRNIFGGMGSGHEPVYFGARNDRECGTLSFVRGSTVMLRWPFMLAFAILGLFLVNELFADQSQLQNAAALIHGHFGSIAEQQWVPVISNIINNPASYPELTEQLQSTLGPEWLSKLNLVSYHGNINPERILPAVILHTIPIGFRGLILVALIGASMSTFDTNMNTAMGYFTRDIYQRYIRPKASNKELVRTSWVFALVMVVLAFLLSFTVRNINEIWGWIIMGLAGGLTVPFFLRFYWWRFNGEGFAFGMVFGLLTAFIQRTFFPELGEISQFLLVLATGTAGCLLGTLIGKPTDPEVLQNFYQKTMPFGFWSPLKRKLDPSIRAKMENEHKNDIISVPFVYGWQITLFLWPMLLIIGNWKGFFVTFTLFLLSLTGMYFFWYKKLPQSDYYTTENKIQTKTQQQQQDGPVLH